MNWPEDFEVTTRAAHEASVKNRQDNWEDLLLPVALRIIEKLESLMEYAESIRIEYVTRNEFEKQVISDVKDFYAENGWQTWLTNTDGGQKKLVLF